MKEVRLEQKSDQWKSWRRNGVTATESAVIAGKSPFMTPWRLWMIKAGKMLEPDLSSVPAIRFGVEHEPIARRMFESTHDTLVVPTCGEFDEDPVFRASFDGLTLDGEPVEIKCPQETTLADVRANGRQSEAFRLYYTQVQHQLLVSGAARGWLVFLDNDHLIEFEVARDEAAIASIRSAGRQFWESLLAGKAPAKDPMRDVFEPQGEENIERWVQTAKELKSVLERISELEKACVPLKEQKSRLTKELTQMMGQACSANFAGIALTRRTSAGSINTEKLMQAHGLTLADINACREKGSESWLVRSVECNHDKAWAPDESFDQMIDSIEPAPTLWW